ncbi:MAG: MFS family permease [Actinomycetes bacterium]
MIADRDLLRVELSWSASNAASWYASAVIPIYVYSRVGLTAATLVFVAQYVPAALLAPFINIATDRFKHKTILLASGLTGAAAIACSALVFYLDWPLWIVYLAIAIVGAARTVVRPAVFAFLRAQAPSQATLTASNLVASTLDAVGQVFGLLLGALLITHFGAGVAFIGLAALLVGQGACVIGISEKAVSRARSVSTGSVVRSLSVGARILWRNHDARILVIFDAVKEGVQVYVTVVLLAVSLYLFPGDAGGYAWLLAAMGLGGVFSIGFIPRLASIHAAARIGAAIWTLTYGVVVIAIALVVLDATDIALESAVVIALMFAFGVGAYVGAGLLARQTQLALEQDTIGRTLGVAMTVRKASSALGAIAAHAALLVLGTGAALFVVGLIIPALCLLSWRSFRRVDDHIRR